MNAIFPKKVAVSSAFFFNLMVIPLLGHAQSQKVIKAEVVTKDPLQTIEGFGASDAWTCQFAGRWPEHKKSKMADLLFSKKFDKDGKPMGIGLNFWRFAIGGGSTEQGTASGIRSEWRRQPSFLKINGTYDEEALPGQIWFLKAAKARGVKNYVGFVNSPHVNFTLNKKAFSSQGKCNLDFAKSEAFCADLVETIAIIRKKTGITLDYLSPVNEPQWKWNEGNQEGCPYTNQEIASLVKTLNHSLKKEKLKTKIQIGEAGQLDYLTTNRDSAKSQQIRYFFEPSSKGYLADLSNLDRSISGHSYFTTSPEHRSLTVRKNVGQMIAEYKDLRFWMSEYCILGDSLMKGEKRDLGILPALFIAKLIHHDLVYANATSWQWWLSISAGDYKDGLIYIDNNKADGNVYESKMLWAIGNYSRFIPAGSKRLDVKFDDTRDLYLSSYLSGDKIITVAVNYGNDPLSLELNGISLKERNLKLYTTSSTKDLAPSTSKSKNISLAGQSITTIIGYLDN